MKPRLSRRTAPKTSAVAGLAMCHGVSRQNLVAFADVDEKRAAGTFEKFPKVQRFSEHRELLDQLGSKLDAVVISTPDHTHFHPAYAAMQKDP